MKKVISLIILGFMLLFIIGMTSFALQNKETHIEKTKGQKKDIEKVSSNNKDNSLIEIYNVFFNDKKHKVKITYNKDDTSTDINVYFDGKLTYKDILGTSELEIDEYLIKENNMHFEPKLENAFIITINYEESKKEAWIVIKNDGEVLFDNGVVIYDEDNNYIDSKKNAIPLYSCEDKKCYTIINDNEIKTLQLEEYEVEVITTKVVEEETKEEKKKIKKNKIVEYSYSFKDDEIEKKEINTFLNVTKVVE